MGNQLSAKIPSSKRSLDGDTSSGTHLDRHQQLKGEQHANPSDVESEDNILHFAQSFPARLVDAATVDAALLPSPTQTSSPGQPSSAVSFMPPMSPRASVPPRGKFFGRPVTANQAAIREGNNTENYGMPVRMTMVDDRLLLEPEELIVGRPEAQALVATTFANLSEVCWDHAHSAVRLSLEGRGEEGKERGREGEIQEGVERGSGGGERQLFILIFPNSLEVEQDLKLRLTALRRPGRSPHLKKQVPFQYIGMFAGPTKPKPFQRKRANLSCLKAGTLPSLERMRELAVAQVQGASVPVARAASRRLSLALQHIHTGSVCFPVLRIKDGDAIFTSASAVLTLSYDGVKYQHDTSSPSRHQLDATLPFSRLRAWECLASHPPGSSNNGISLSVEGKKGSYLVSVHYASDAGHALEFFWNRFLYSEKMPAMPGSTYGREIEEAYSITGVHPRPLLPRGSMTILDAQGHPVYDLDEISGSERSSIDPLSSTPAASVGGSDPSTGQQAQPEGGRKGGAVLPRPSSLGYWKEVVLHQGWLLKKGGFNRKWLKRYFVLYKTCMGHILCYYSDVHETALFAHHPQERNVIDCCRVELLRPVSSTPDTPSCAFDVQSIERTWTVCAANETDLQQWLLLLASAIDMDVAVLPDDEVSFLVKPRVDPSMKLYLDEYSTILRVHAWGVNVDMMEGEKRHTVCFWPYTDLFRWTILSQKGKIALQLTVFKEDYSAKSDYIFRTRKASQIARTLEFYIEKYMAWAHMRLELEDVPPSPLHGDVHTQTGLHKGPSYPPPTEMHHPRHARRHSGGSEPASAPSGHGTGGGGTEGGTEEDTGGDAGVWASDDEGGNDDRQEDFLELDAACHAFLHDDDKPQPSPSPSPSPPSPPSPQPPALSHTTSATYVAKGIPPSLLPSMVQWSCTLAASGQGLLFQYPSLLQVLLRHNYQGHQGTLLIVYKNVSPLPSSPTSAAPSLQFRTFQASPSSTVPGLLLQASPLQVSVLGPGEEASQTVRVVCLEPFDASAGGIEVLVEFGTEEEEDGTNAIPVRYSLPLPLPVSVLHFVWGLSLRKEDFLAQWEAITVPQVQDTFLPKEEDGKGEGLEMGPLIRLLTKQFHLQTVPELCQRSRQAQTWTFAGSLETGSLSPHGKQLRVLVLVRLEQYEEGVERCARGRKGYRLTVRSEHPACAMGVFKAIKLQLGA